MEEKLQKALEALKAWEEWEASIILDDECWAPDGMAPYPTLTDKTYERMIEIQSLRNDAIKLLTNP